MRDSVMCLLAWTTSLELDLGLVWDVVPACLPPPLASKPLIKSPAPARKLGSGLFTAELYFALYNEHLLVQIFEGKRRMSIIPVWY